MRILHVITTINRGGAESHLVELATGQAARGHAVAIAYLKGDGYWTERLRQAGIHVARLRLSRYGDLRPLLRLRRLLREWRPDLVHAHLPPAELYARLALLGSGRRPPLVISKHNDEPFYYWPALEGLGRWVARRARRMIVISDAVRAYMRDRLGISDALMRTVHYGIDPRPYDAVDPQASERLRAAWGAEPGDLVIGTVARLVPQKALHVLLTAFARFAATAQCRSRLVLVGNGPLLGELQALAHQLGIGDAVVWAGFRDDIPTVMAAFDVFALTSIYEGFGLVLLEAMAAGRPVVATAVSAIPEVVADGETGLLCAVGDANAIAAAFRRLEDAALRGRLGEAGRARAREVFALDRMTDATLAIYRDCLQEGVA